MDNGNKILSLATNCSKGGMYAGQAKVNRKVFLVKSGNVGININNPVEALEVSGNVKATSFIGDGSGLTGIASGTGGLQNTGSTTIGADTDSDGVGELAFQTRGTTKLALKNDGKVGIGTTNPSTELTVVGAITATSFAGSGADLTAVNASNISTGTLDNARLNSSVSLLGQKIDASEIDGSVNTANYAKRATTANYSVLASTSNKLANMNISQFTNDSVYLTSTGTVSTANYAKRATTANYSVLASTANKLANMNISQFTNDRVYLTSTGTIGTANIGLIALTANYTRLATTASVALSVIDNAITTAKIGDSQVTDAKISAVSSSKLTGKIQVVNNKVGIGNSSPSAALHVSADSGMGLLKVGYAADQNIIVVSNNGKIGFGIANPKEGKLVISNAGDILSGLDISCGGAQAIIQYMGGPANLSPVQIGDILIDTIGDAYTINNINSNTIGIDGSCNSTGAKKGRIHRSAMIIKNGFVGIGTDTPAYNLDVVGTINAKAILQNEAPLTNYALHASDGEPLNAIYVDAVGHVGIGTTVPQNNMDVEGSAVIGAAYSGTSVAPVNGALIEGNVGIGTNSPQNKLDVEGSVVIGSTYSGTSIAPANGLLVEGSVGIKTSNPTGVFQVGAKDFVVNNGGKVGIGVSNPSRSILEVYGGGDIVSGLDVTFCNANRAYFNVGTNLSQIVVGDIFIDENGDILHVQEVNDGSDYLGLNANCTQGGIFDGNAKIHKYSVVIGSGNVGIGTFNPESALHVIGTIIVRQKIQADNSNGLELATDEGRTRLFMRDNGNIGIGNTAPTGLFQVSTNYVVVSRDGKVGIGTTSPLSALHVEGTIEVDQKIKANDNGGLELATDEGLTRLFIQDNGNVGIGNTAPTGLFQVSTNYIVVSRNGNVGIGNTLPQSILEVGGAIATPISTKSTSYTLTISDSVILANAAAGNIVMTLPTAVGINGREYYIKKTDTALNTVTINTTSSQTIDGETSYLLTTQWEYIKIVSNGSNWVIIGSN